MPEVKATHRYLRTSAFKVREVLDLVRGLPVEEARQVLRFQARGSARNVLKVLDSAVANAEHNNHLPEEELYVAKCFADEGMTLKRWRPRARGRATRIRKRTSHLTVIVDRMPEKMLVAQQAQEERKTGTRSARVAASKRAQEKAKVSAPAADDSEGTSEVSAATAEEGMPEGPDQASEAVAEASEDDSGAAEGPSEGSKPEPEPEPAASPPEDEEASGSAGATDHEEESK